jgi:hypothetical protein
MGHSLVLMETSFLFLGKNRGLVLTQNGRRSLPRTIFVPSSLISPDRARLTS